MQIAEETETDAEDAEADTETDAEVVQIAEETCKVYRDSKH